MIWTILGVGSMATETPFFEGLAPEFRLTRDRLWPKRLAAFDAGVRLIAEHAQPGNRGTETPPTEEGTSP